MSDLRDVLRNLADAFADAVERRDEAGTETPEVSQSADAPTLGAGKSGSGVRRKKIGL